MVKSMKLTYISDADCPRSKLREKDVQHFICEVVKCPEVGSPIVVYQPSLKRKQPAKYLPSLLNSSNGDKGQKSYYKRYKSDYSDLS